MNLYALDRWLKTEIGMAVIVATLIIGALISIARVEQNVQARANPPVTCSLFGGHWSWWNGWECR
jgi:hypothetical protein